MLIAMEPRTAAGTSLHSLRPRTFFLWAGAILLVYLVLAVGDALVSVPWCDEAWLSNPALTFLRSGYLGTPILTAFGWGPPQSLLHIEHRTYWIMPLQMISEIGWFRLFGYSLLSLRSFSILWGAVALAGTGAVARLLTGRARVALGAMLFAGTDYFYLSRASDGRMDIMAAAFLLTAFALYLWQRTRSLTRAVALGGVFAALATFTHPVGGFFVLLGLGFLALYFDRRRLRPLHLVLFGLPFLVIGACWGAYVLQDLPAFRSQMAGNAAGRWEGITQPFNSVYREFRFKYFQAFGLNSFTGVSLQNLRLLALAAYLLAPIGVALNRVLRAEDGVRALLWLTGLFVFGGMAFDGAKRWYYLTYLIPLFVTLLAVWVEWAWSARRVPRPALAAAVGVFVLIQAGGTLYRMKKNDYQNQFVPAARFIAAHDPEHAPVMGSGELGFELGFPSYLIDDVSLGYFSGVKPKLIFVPAAYWAIWLDTLKSRQPPVGQFVAATLERDYTTVYDKPPFRIYERKDARR